MLTTAAYLLDAALMRLHRKPVLTAMMVSSLVLGVSALAAGIGVWRVSSPCAIAPPANTVQVVADVDSRSNLLMYQALQVELVMGVGQIPESGSTVSRKDAPTCPCAASSEWHWQLI